MAITPTVKRELSRKRKNKQLLKLNTHRFKWQKKIKLKVSFQAPVGGRWRKGMQWDMAVIEEGKLKGIIGHRLPHKLLNKALQSRCWLAPSPPALLSHECFTCPLNIQKGWKPDIFISFLCAEMMEVNEMYVLLEF